MSFVERHSSSLAVAPHGNNDNNDLFLDILEEAPLFGHRKRTKIIGSVIYCLLLTGYAILAVRPTWILNHLEELVPLLLCSCDVILLVVTGIFQQYLVFQVKKIRLQGYYGFSQKLKHIIRLPFATIAYGTAGMLLIMAWKPHLSILSISMILRIIMLVEATCAGFFMSVYIGYVHQYNSLNSQPDVLNSLYSPLQQASSLEGLRYYDGGRLSDQQMALLQYQRENLHFLSEEILRLQECLSKYERSDDGITPRVDLAHLLAARDQELRTVSAEMNQLQSELTLARSLIAERDTEIQRFRNTNNQDINLRIRPKKSITQIFVLLKILSKSYLTKSNHSLSKKYVEENERLRAILGEWSARAAKLERALEVERMSNLEMQKKITVLNGRAAQEQVEPNLQLDQ